MAENRADLLRLPVSFWQRRKLNAIDRLDPGVADRKRRHRRRNSIACPKVSRVSQSRRINHCEALTQIMAVWRLQRLEWNRSHEVVGLHNQRRNPTQLRSKGLHHPTVDLPRISLQKAPIRFQIGAE